MLVHHGLFWDFHPTGLTPVLAERLRPLFKHDIALAGYHLPLDAHPELGNNAILAERLGCERHEPFARAADRPRRDVRRRRHRRGRAVRARARGHGARADRVRRRPGARAPHRHRLRLGGRELPEEAIALGLDAFLTGEPREHVMADAREAGIHFIAAGHYATETFGVRALGDWLAARFGVEHVWVDIPNPV